MSGAVLLLHMIKGGAGGQEFLQHFINHGYDVHPSYHASGTSYQCYSINEFFKGVQESQTDHYYGRWQHPDAWKQSDMPLKLLEAFARTLQLSLTNNVLDMIDTPFLEPLILLSSNGLSPIDVNMHLHNHNSVTFLMLSSQKNNINLVEHLLNNGAIANLQDINGKTALFYAIQTGNKEIMDKLIEKGADVKATANDGSTILHEAVKHGKLELIDEIIKQGVDINAVEYYNDKTALFYAIQTGNKEVVDKLIEKGADVKALTRDGSTILHEALTHGQFDLFDEIIKKGINIDAVDNAGHTALYHASRIGLPSAVKILLEMGANPDWTNSPEDQAKKATEESRLSQKTEEKVTQETREKFFEEIDDFAHKYTDIAPRHKDKMKDYVQDHIQGKPLSERNHEFFVKLCKAADPTIDSEEIWQKLMESNNHVDFAHTLDDVIHYYIENHKGAFPPDTL